ncbi:MAG TPA: hypothetical protein VF765_02510 [Polyangiaceae bacterium]
MISRSRVIEISTAVAVALEVALEVAVAVAIAIESSTPHDATQKLVHW